MEELTIRRNTSSSGAGGSCPYAGIGFPLLSQPPLPWMPYLTPAPPALWPAGQPSDAHVLDSLSTPPSVDADSASVITTSTNRALSPPSESAVTSTTPTSVQQEKSAVLDESIIVRPQPVIASNPATLAAVPFDPLVTIQALEVNPVINRALTSRLSRRPRSEKRPIPDDMKDEKYYERRKRNNLAAKKSRDARKAREDQIAFRACLLEKENAVLRAQVAILREEGYWLRQLLSQRRPQRP